MKRRRRAFRESDVHRWPAESPGSKGGEFAPQGAPGGAGWASALAARLPPIGVPSGPVPARPSAGRPPAKGAPKPSTPPRPTARLMDEARAAGWTADVRYQRRPKNGDMWTVTMRRDGTEHVASWTKDPTTGRARYSGNQRLKDITAALGQPVQVIRPDGDETTRGWVQQLTDRMDRRRDRAYGTLTDSGLRDMYDKILGRSGPTTPDDLDQADLIWAEMVRRDTERFTEGTRLDDGLDLSPEQLQVDDLVARGIDYIDAVTEVYGKIDLVDRRPGERQVEAIRRVYREWVALSYLAAEQATNGHMVNPAGRDRRVKGKPDPISPRSLFSGPTARAGKYASPELLEFWETHPRLTLEQFTAQVTRSDSRAARKSRERAQDLGLKT